MTHLSQWPPIAAETLDEKRDLWQALAETDRSRGRVRWFSGRKGYGFIDLDGRDVYVHYTQINAEGYRTLREGDAVEFTLVDAPKGPAARDVNILR